MGIFVVAGPWRGLGGYGWFQSPAPQNFKRFRQDLAFRSLGDGDASKLLMDKFNVVGSAGTEYEFFFALFFQPIYSVFLGSLLDVSDLFFLTVGRLFSGRICVPKLQLNDIFKIV